MIEADELKQKLARIEHERWASWQDWMHKICTRNPDGSITIPSDLVERWDRQIQTEYADLSDKEKESDLKEVNRYWWLVEAYINERLSQHRGTDLLTDSPEANTKGVKGAITEVGAPPKDATGADT